MSDDQVLNHILNPEAPLVSECQEIEADPLPQSQEGKEAKRLELLGVKLAEENKFPESMAKFDEAIKLAPHIASLYNNRAQLLRLLSENERAMQDINTAIEISRGTGNTAVQAYTQRAMLHMLNNEEEAARQDFEKASGLGGRFAANHAAKLNPYAKMCNQMLSKAMDSLQ